MSTSIHLLIYYCSTYTGSIIQYSVQNMDEWMKTTAWMALWWIGGLSRVCPTFHLAWIGSSFSMTRTDGWIKYIMLRPESCQVFYGQKYVNNWICGPSPISCHKVKSIWAHCNGCLCMLYFYLSYIFSSLELSVQNLFQNLTMPEHKQGPWRHVL